MPRLTGTPSVPGEPWRPGKPGLPSLPGNPWINNNYLFTSVLNNVCLCWLNLLTLSPFSPFNLLEGSRGVDGPGGPWRPSGPLGPSLPVKPSRPYININTHMSKSKSAFWFLKQTGREHEKGSQNVNILHRSISASIKYEVCWYSTRLVLRRYFKLVVLWWNKNSCAWRD